ncbi:histidine phosphatase family protein [Nocardioides sp. GY 10127]|uniref:histidine phosphatase family protein n=1 Tax=Nocardioides sp. GY 10127 TaxID=2569762 RepID=UPI0014583211|nr:histidine phosphatase family protein [Nocardioides sp. GY 10127]
MVTLTLVRHGRPLVDPALPPSAWELDPAAFDEVWALRDVLSPRSSPRASSRAFWACSPERKAVETAQLLTDGDVGVLPSLVEQRGRTWLPEGLDAAVADALARPSVPARPGWEPVADLRARLVATVDALRAEHPGRDLVLVGHGLAWTVLEAAVRGTEPTPGEWRAWGFPDVHSLPLP